MPNRELTEAAGLEPPYQTSSHEVILGCVAQTDTSTYIELQVICHGINESAIQVVAPAVKNAERDQGRRRSQWHAR